MPRAIIAWFVPLALTFLGLATVPSHTALAAPSVPAPSEEADHRALRDALAAADRGDWTRAYALAGRVGQPVATKLIAWAHFTSPGSGSMFETLTAFLEANPDWPQPGLLQQRAEEAITAATPDRLVLAWFDKRAPMTAEGRAAYGRALLRAGQAEKAIPLIRQAWVNGNFGAQQEKDFLDAFKGHLRPDDHVARLDRLLWDGQAASAKRLYRKVGEGHRALAEARVALRAMAPGVEAAIRRVPAKLLDDPGLAYERLRWRRVKELDDAAREILLHPPKSLVRPDKWWDERSVLARRALRAGHISEAYRMVKAHGLNEGADYAEAEFLAGWIALRFLKDATVALGHFEKLYKAVQYPVSRARGAYWAGRAAEELGRQDQARQWYEAAARHATTYYGQLAATKLSPGKSRLSLPRDPEPSANDKAAFERQELVKAARLLLKVGAFDRARLFLLRLEALGKTDEQRALVANLANEHKRPELAVAVAKRAIQSGTLLLGAGYPIPEMTFAEAPEKALTLSVTRQESAFDTEARSPAGARGLMQLLPSTAKEVARRLGSGFHAGKLTEEPAFNVRLGQRYMADLLGRFGGSYVLAVAAYNAGPARVSSWIREFGDPRDTKHVDVIDWIETIPFGETRNYVHRVIEGLYVYRSRLGHPDIAAIPAHWLGN